MNQRQRMSLLFVSAVICLTLAGWVVATAEDAKPATKPGDSAKADREALQGTWKIVSVEANGKTDAGPAESVLTFDGDEVYEFKAGEKKDPAVFRLDPAKAPKQLDLIPQAGPEKGATIQAIYEVKGDTVRLALGDKNKRPAAFKSSEGVVVLTLARQKAKG